MATPTLDTDVLVVGAGPAGLTAALLLHASGTAVTAISRHHGTAPNPRAHYQNQRSIEILRELDLDTEIVAAARRPEDSRHVVWTETLAGEEFARVTNYSGTITSEYVDASPVAAANIPQHDFERILAASAAERGLELRRGQHLNGLDQDADGVTAHIQDRDSGAEYTIRAKYLIGADGARSTVADALGVRFTGAAGWGASVNVWFHADLSRYTAYRPGTLFWTNVPGADFWLGSGGFISIRPWDEWILSFMYDPAQGQPDLSDAGLTRRIRSLVGDPTLKVDILNASPWSMSALVAGRIRVGRAFLIGDAAHRHPPSGGLGSNVSMQDAHNLAWKLRAVLDGWAGSELLDSFESERLPEAAEVVARTMGNIEKTKVFNGALGFRPGQSAEEAWAAYAELSQPGQVGDARRARFNAALTLQREHFSALGVDMGRPYATGAFVADPDAEPFQHDLLHFHYDSRPGNRLPHGWLDRGTERRSALDLVASTGLTAFLGIGSRAWTNSLAAAAATTGVPITVVAIGRGQEWCDTEGQWTSDRGVGEDGLLLVRPDRIVAWRAGEPSVNPTELTATLVEVISAVLSLRPGVADAGNASDPAADLVEAAEVSDANSAANAADATEAVEVSDATANRQEAVA